MSKNEIITYCYSIRLNYLRLKAEGSLVLCFQKILYENPHENTAIICSLLASCKGAGINPKWLKDVIAKMPYYCQPGKTKSLKKLLPAQWQPNKR